LAQYLTVPAVGKSHPAVGLGLKVIEHAYRVLFTTAAGLITSLTKSVSRNERRQPGTGRNRDRAGAMTSSAISQTCAQRAGARRHSAHNGPSWEHLGLVPIVGEAW